jgi:hypothetical protein
MCCHPRQKEEIQAFEQFGADDWSLPLTSWEREPFSQVLNNPPLLRIQLSDYQPLIPVH